MHCVLAKIKGNGKKKIFKLLSDKTLFENEVITPGMCVDYSADHNLDEDSWFKIEQFSSKQYCIPLLKVDFVPAEYDELSRSQFPKISYLCAIQGDDYYFQKVTPSLFLSRKMIAFGEVAQLEQSENRLVVNSQPDAIYLKQSDTLVFKNLATISSIFKGIDELYKEATDEEVVEFLEMPFVEAQNGFNKSKVSKPNRKRVALALDTLAKMSAEDRNLMLSYVESYCSGLMKFDKDSGAVQVSSDEELKLLLYGVEQRFYTTPFGKEKRLANSVQLIAGNPA
ncbi:MAG: ATP F0F1 synthase synthase [Halobacteriota archaeon]